MECGMWNVEFGMPVGFCFFQKKIGKTFWYPFSDTSSFFKVHSVVTIFTKSGGHCLALVEP